MKEKILYFIIGVLFIVAISELVVIIFQSYEIKELTSRSNFKNENIDAGNDVVPDNLENDLKELEEIGVKEVVKKTSEIIPTSPKKKKNSMISPLEKKWRSLQNGMSPSEVEAILGKPKTKKQGLTSIWYYKYADGKKGEVAFYKNEVITWTFPTRELNSKPKPKK